MLYKICILPTKSWDGPSDMSDTKIYTPRIFVNRDLRVHPRSKSALATQNAGSTPWRAFALKTRDDGGQVVLPGPFDRGEGGPREGRVRPKPHRNRSSPRRHLGLDQGHGRLGESRERERGLLSFVGATDGSLTPPHSASTLPLASRRPGLQELISNVPIFMTPLEKDLKEYYTPGKPNRDKEVAQMKEVSESKGKDSRRMKSRREIPSLTPRILPLPFHWHVDDRGSRSLSATFPFL